MVNKALFHDFSSPDLDALRETRKWHRETVFGKHKLVIIRLRHSDTAAANGFHEQIRGSEYPRFTDQLDRFAAKPLFFIRSKMTPSGCSVR